MEKKFYNGAVLRVKAKCVCTVSHFCMEKNSIMVQFYGKKQNACAQFLNFSTKGSFFKEDSTYAIL